MPREPYTFNDIVFPTKEAVRTHIRGILYSYPVGERLNETDLAFMLAILEEHPRLEEKLKGGVVVAMDVRKNPYGQVGFYLIRGDGSDSDWSFNECLTPKSHYRLFKDACRRTIKDQVLAHKNDFFDTQTDPKCPLNGSPLSPDDCHVDHHDPTFDLLVVRFLKVLRAEGTEVKDVKIKGLGQDHAIEKFFEDEALAERFAEFHRTHAKLRVISKQANLSPLRTGMKKLWWDRDHGIYWYGPEGEQV